MNSTIDATVLIAHQRQLLWDGIPWEKVIEQVRRLQIRIAKAWKEGNFRKVKSLQRLLQKSFYAKLLAVKRVTSNKGGKTPGIDKVIWKKPETKKNAASQLGKDKYIPQPLRRIYILKKNGKKRPLGIPTMLDRAQQALHLLTLEPISETTADRNSYGFRPCRSTADAIEQCFNALARKSCSQYILEGDIKACFDEISHEWILKNIPMDKKILGKFLKAGFMEKNVFHETTAGTPQGGIISPTLANMVLDGVDDYFQSQFGSRIAKHHINFIRYADDFIITANSKEFLENEVKPKLAIFLQERGLRLSEEKTKITHIHKGFDFLGQTIRKFKDKLIIKPSDKSIKAILDKIREICNRNKQAKTSDLIKILNPIIRGWANYHRHVVSSREFSKMDHIIFQIIWKWAKRRHPNKGLRWIKDKYFKSHRGRNWTFTGKCEDGTIIILFNMSRIHIRRHIKIKQDANPFDPIWERYFENRERKKLFEKWKGKIQSEYIFERQNNLCAICNEEIPKKNKWEYHFKKPWMHGGLPQNTNLVIVHPSCHERIHEKNDTKLGP